MRISNRSSYKPSSKDDCQTPPYGVMPLRPFLAQLQEMLGRETLILWEPAPGEGYLINGLRKLGHVVISTYTDFAEFSKPPIKTIDAIITNPPYNIKSKRMFIRQCDKFRREMGLSWALLMSATALHDKTTKEEMRGCSIAIPRGRISYKMPLKGWGTPDNPTKPTFETTWYLAIASNSTNTPPPTISHDDFDMGPHHFRALERWESMYPTLAIPTNREA